MLLWSTIFAAAGAFASNVTGCQNGIIVGEVLVRENGQVRSMPVSQFGGNNGRVSIQGSRMTFRHDSRVYLGNTCPDQFQPDMFHWFQLLGKTISFNVYLQAPSCGCNAAIYLLSMPANGGRDPTKCGDYYCDANYVCGPGCPEIDLMEANNRAFQATPHRCTPSGDVWTNCDGGGCGLNSWKSISPNAFGYGNGFTIDSSKVFQVNSTFHEQNGVLMRITTTLYQDGKSVLFDFGQERCGSYVQSLTDAVKRGMVLTVSFWGTDGGTMSWLDVPPCDAGVPCDPYTSWWMDNIIIS